MQTNIKKQSKYKILTTEGFKDFLGISKTTNKAILELICENSSIKCTYDHKFLNSLHKWQTASELQIGDVLLKAGCINNIIECGYDDVYDILHVDDVNHFLANDKFISHNCSFLGSSQTLISSETLLGLTSIEPLKRQYGVNYYYEPEEGHEYIMTVDVSKGRGQDYSTFSVIDISSMPFKMVCTYRDNTVSPLIFPELIVRAAKTYNNALAVVENNDSGQVVCNSLYYNYEYDNTFVQSSVKSSGIGVTMTKRVKRIGCSNLKDLVESGKLQIVDPHTIHELSSFEPKGDSYAASGSTHDDMVMNLVLFAWFVSTDAFGGMSNVDLKELLYSDKIREMEEDLPPFGIIDTPAYDKTPSMIDYERQKQAIADWNSL